MNSTISTDQLLYDSININDEYYLPFWTILQFLDTAPPDPFVKVVVSEKKWNNAMSPDGKIEILCCDLKCIKPHITINDIPAGYLIKLEDIGQWSNKIATWFNDFPESI